MLSWKKHKRIRRTDGTLVVVLVGVKLVETIDSQLSRCK
ncbi:hypothetical protein M7I_1024 [Glarea lozoyensis 74030]|uniref:Uncharacterized protein n=1 Tax=Glarea lozoyensis (strain ATCC 74030 / MF5533) TaxID=1104152 RepID=H0EEY7_GLAL7|nr:hypothetical protein M7I_1024 [Glarea lozoyensis 74030]